MSGVPLWVQNWPRLTSMSEVFLLGRNNRFLLYSEILDYVWSQILKTRSKSRCSVSLRGLMSCKYHFSAHPDFLCALK